MNGLRDLLKMTLVVLAFSLFLGACSNNASKNTDPKKDANKKAAPLDPSGIITIRYIDEDSVLKKYNLAKDFQELAVRLEDEFDQEEHRLANQANAENVLSKLRDNIDNQMQQSEKQLLDSIDNCLSDYAKRNHIDVIMKKGACFYLNPNLEITDEVIDELNRRYTKVAAKQ